MMRKIAKAIAPIFILVMLIAELSATAHADTFTQTHIIDNDDAQGYSNIAFGFGTLFQANNLYYSDARRQACVSSSSDNYHERYRYHYCFPTYRASSPAVGRISAYLYNASFTDPYATYSISSRSSYYTPEAGYINQDFAAAGWNVIGVACTTLSTPTSSGTFYYTGDVILEPSSGYPTKNCGADAIKVELGYR